MIDEVERLAGELASRERALTASQKLPVRTVEIEIETPLEEHIRVHVEQHAHDLLKNLVGEEVETLNPLLIEKALQRTLHVDKQDFIVTPTLIVLGEQAACEAARRRRTISSFPITCGAIPFDSTFDHDSTFSGGKSFTNSSSPSGSQRIALHFGPKRRKLAVESLVSPA